MRQTLTAPKRQTLAQLRPGSAGTKQTLNLMRQIVRRYKRYVPLRDLALKLIDYEPGSKNFVAQIESVQNYVKNNINYVRDVVGVETVQTPEITIQNRSGDCDDQSVLIASLLETIGHPTRFVAIKTRPFAPYSHVFVETKIGTKWVAVETTENWPFGAQPSNVAGRMVVHN